MDRRWLEDRWRPPPSVAQTRRRIDFGGSRGSSSYRILAQPYCGAPVPKYKQHQHPFQSKSSTELDNWTYNIFLENKESARTVKTITFVSVSHCYYRTRIKSEAGNINSNDKPSLPLSFHTESKPTVTGSWLWQWSPVCAAGSRDGISEGGRLQSNTGAECQH
jgi:hypothetical protein